MAVKLGQFSQASISRWWLRQRCFDRSTTVRRHDRRKYPRKYYLGTIRRSHPYYTLNGGETGILSVYPACPRGVALTRHITLTRKSLRTVCCRIPFICITQDRDYSKSTNGGVTWTRQYSGQIGSESDYNAELQSVPGEAGNLFFTGGQLAEAHQMSQQMNPSCGPPTGEPRGRRCRTS